MPKKQKTKFAKKKGNRKFKKSSAPVANNKEVTVRLPYKKNLQMFPDRYLCKGHVSKQYNLQILPSATGNYNQPFLYIGGNYLGGSINNFQPNNSTNGTWYVNGSTTAGNSVEVPAGLAYLLGKSNAGSATGASAPFLNYRIHSSMIKVEVISIPNSSSVATTGQLTIFPANETFQLTGTGTNSTVVEQPYAKTIIIPGLNVTSKPTKLVGKMSTLRIVGDKYKSSIENGKYDNTYNTTCSDPWYWMVVISNLQTLVDYQYACVVNIDMWYDIEFFNRSQYNSTIPS